MPQGGGGGVVTIDRVSFLSSVRWSYNTGIAERRGRVGVTPNGTTVVEVPCLVPVRAQ